MNVYIIDHQPIYVLGLEKYIQQVFHSKINIETCQSVLEIDTGLMNKTNLLIVNLELFTTSFRDNVGRINVGDLMMVGLVDPENMDILLHVQLVEFNALILKSTVLDELKMLFSFLHQNRKYYSPEIIEYLNNNKNINQNHLKYERYQ